MRIVSQAKDLSFNFDYIDLFVCDNIVGCNTVDGKRQLGRYHSADRAKEVFMDIHDAYAGNTVVYADIDDDILADMSTQEALSYFEAVHVDYELCDDVVFYMPLD